MDETSDQGQGEVVQGSNASKQAGSQAELRAPAHLRDSESDRVGMDG